MAGSAQSRAAWQSALRAWVTSSIGDLPILVLFRRQGYVCECSSRGSVSVLRLIPMGVFGGATFPNIGRAFDLACKELNDAGQPDVVHEVSDQKNHHGRPQR
jgi:hypothetical protein